MKINKKVIDILKAEALGLESYLILYSKYYKKPWLSYWKIQDYQYKSLIHRGYLTKNKQLTALGVQLMESMKSDEEVSQLKYYKEEFEKFWKAFPTSDGHAHFSATRPTRVGKKPEVFKQYMEELEDEKVTPELILNALESHIKALKKQSMLNADNRLRFLPAPKKWLSQKDYLIWAEAKPIAFSQNIPSKIQ
jgi:hypothetical protein